MRRTVAFAAAALAAFTALALGAPASAATGTPWADWTPLQGTGGAYSGSVQIASPQLKADYTSDSLGGSVGVFNGDSVWLAASTDVGAKYGSSRDQQYLNLRPRADNATSPSETTYTFAHPTPTANWTFVLGDIDADQVRITALGPDGRTLTAAQLGFRGGFNYCAPGLAGKPSCTGDAADVPSWDPATTTLTGNAAAADTSGAAAWFEPNAPISSLTFAFTRRAGFPVYQTWFAAITRTISGTVTDTTAGTPSDGTVVRLIGSDGTVLGEATTSADGPYAFPDVLATGGYRVEITPPAGKISDQPARAVDVTDGDGTADFTVRDIVPVPVSGAVRDQHGNPIAGATVTLDGGRTVVTAADGTYLLDDVAVGQHTVTITAPDGYTVVSSPEPFTVPAGVETPITGQDFVLQALPTLSGTVTAVGTGVGGVVVTASGPGGTVQAVTAADGTYAFPRLPAGEYTVSVEAPQGYVVSGAASRSETVAADDVTQVDFALARLGSVSGAVTDDGGSPIANARVTVNGSDGPRVVTTGDDGGYALGDLPAGDYVITVTVPDGYTGATPASRSVTITDAGELVDAQDFVLTPVAVTPTPTPTPTPTVTPTPTPTPTPAPGGTGGGSLPPTGADPLPALGAASVLLLAGTFLVLAVRRRRA
ncbi:MAG: carboxypeptidase regulatory-like domain-containing protein [Actinobacteria bacterium]|nr:carboxypeptidase regulatory-like domain-containing protein [Actinomycetota bacterium]